MTRTLLLVLCVATAYADDKPWVVGVSEAQQASALAIYEQGNVEFHAARFTQALAKYAEALKHWEHPAIHFNMAVCFINLDQPLAAKEHLERAMKFGPEPLGGDVYAQGITHRHSLDGQISRVKIACSEPDTKVTLDGVYLFTGPGEAERLVLPGKHQVVGTKPGFMTASETLDLLPARLTKHDVHLLALKATTRLVRRWPRWQPWAVVGTGAAIAGIGGLLYWHAARQFDRYDEGVAKACPHGCDAAMTTALGELDAMKQQGYTEQTIAFTLFTVGSAVAVGGGIAAYLNLPRTQATVTPTDGGAALSFSTRW